MRLRFVVFLGLGLLAFATCPCRASDLALVGAKIYPSPAQPAIENGSVVVHDGLVVSVGPNSSIHIPPGATVMDCKGLVVTPGFWNSHVHIFTPALLHVREAHAQDLDEQLDAMFNRRM